MRRIPMVKDSDVADPEGTPEEALDQRYLEELKKLNEPGKADIVDELAAIFFETAPVKVSAIGEAARSNLLLDVRQEAHSLKSTCFNVGAMRMARVCGELEAIAEAGVAKEFAEKREQLLRRLEKEAEQARRELEKLVS